MRAFLSKNNQTKGETEWNFEWKWRFQEWRLISLAPRCLPHNQWEGKQQPLNQLKKRRRRKKRKRRRRRRKRRRRIYNNLKTNTFQVRVQLTKSRLDCEPRRVKCCCCCWGGWLLLLLLLLPGFCSCCCDWGGGRLTSETVPNSLYQPITMLDKSRSSSKIWATPMKTLRPSMRP